MYIVYSRINELVAKFPETSFGSYPSLVNQYFKTRISYDSPSPEQLVLVRFGDKLVKI